MVEEIAKKCIFCSVPTNELDYVSFENIYMEVLNVLLITTYIEISDQTVLCNKCSEKLLELFAFKSICLHTEDFLTNFTNYESDGVLDMTDVFLRKNGNQEKLFLSKAICRLCIRPVLGSMSFTPLTDIDARDLKMLQEYMPEINFKILKEPVVCETCLMCLKEYFTFADKCLLAGSSIENNGNNVKSTSSGKAEKNEEGKIVNKRKYKKRKGGIQECNKCNFKTKWYASLRTHLLRHEDPANVSYKCNHCDFKTIYKHNLEQHKQLHEEYSFVLKTIKCPLCNYRTKQTPCLKNHMLTHKTLSSCKVYKCDKCPFQSKHRSALTYHEIIHKDVPVLKCPQCSYETKHKRSLDAHKLTHNKEKKYACDKCDYKSVTKNCLYRHMSLHREKNLGKTHRCDKCPFETKIINQLKAHKKIHQTPSKTFKCDLCNFESRYKASVIRHEKLNHAEKTQIEMFKCEVCPYESKYKSSLKGHLLTHKNPDDLPVFKCPDCEFETNKLQSMKPHSLKHKDETEVRMFECDKCSFRSRYRLALVNHIVIHGGVFFKCNLCSYQTQHKRNMPGHYKVVHKKGEITEKDWSRVEK